MAAPYIRVVDGEVESVGPLPPTARRLDTGHRVDPRTRLKACGYYDIETFNPAELPPGLTPQQVAAISDTVDDAKDRHRRKTEFVAELRPDLAESARNYDWGWLTRYSFFKFEGLPATAGKDWPNSVAEQITVLRRAMSWALYEQVQLIDFADMAGRLLSDPLETSDIEPPSTPEPPVMTQFPDEEEEPSHD